MIDPCPGCERRELLLWHAAGTLPAEEAALVERALQTCGRCREAFQLDRLLAQSARERELFELSPDELMSIARSSRQDLSHLSEADREIISVLRAVEAEEARQESSWLSRWAGFLGKGLGTLRSEWAYVLVLLLAYPAYRGLVSPAVEGGPRVLAQPVALGDPSRASAGEANVLRAGDDTVVTVFVPVDPAYRYVLAIEDDSGRAVFRAEDAAPFDGIGTFAVMLPANSLPAGRYQIRLDEIDRAASASVVNNHRFAFSLEKP